MEVHLLSPHELEDALNELASIISEVRLPFRWRPQLTDPDDEMVLETAINGFADYIVTHNVRDFLPAALRFGVGVIPPGRIIREVPMMAMQTPISLPDDLLAAAQSEASRSGQALQDWLSSALAERLQASEAAKVFFQRRAVRARPGALRQALDSIPPNPPMPGDEL